MRRCTRYRGIKQAGTIKNTLFNKSYKDDLAHSTNLQLSMFLNGFIPLDLFSHLILFIQPDHEYYGFFTALQRAFPFKFTAMVGQGVVKPFSEALTNEPIIKYLIVLRRFHQVFKPSDCLLISSQR